MKNAAKSGWIVWIGILGLAACNSPNTTPPTGARIRDFIASHDSHLNARQFDDFVAMYDSGARVTLKNPYADQPMAGAMQSRASAETSDFPNTARSSKLLLMPAQIAEQIRNGAGSYAIERSQLTVVRGEARNRYDVHSRVKETVCTSIQCAVILSDDDMTVVDNQGDLRIHRSRNTLADLPTLEPSATILAAP